MNEPTFNLGGVAGARNSQQQWSLAPQGGGGTQAPSRRPGMPQAGPAPQQQVAPGVSGVTPGAIERRLGYSPASMQAGGQGQPASMQARQMVENTPNQVGPDRSVFSGPMGGIQSLISALRARQTDPGVRPQQ